MVPHSLTLGAHLSIAGGLHNALLDARRLNCQCVQLFVANQRQWKHSPLTAEQIDTFIQTRRRTNLNPVVAHSSYLINLAALDRHIRHRSIAALSDEYQRCCKLNIDYLVLHPGAHVGQGPEVGLRKIVSALNTLFSESRDAGCMLLLETTAGQGSCLGCTFEQLAYLIDNVKQSQRLGVCLDTCHIFAAGYDLRTPEACEETIDRFDKIIGLSRLAVVHANDSKTPWNSHVDRHEHIGKGHLGRLAFRHLLSDPRIRRLPLILETPKGKSPGGRDLDMLNLAALRRLGRT